MAMYSLGKLVFVYIISVIQLLFRQTSHDLFECFSLLSKLISFTNFFFFFNTFQEDKDDDMKGEPESKEGTFLITNYVILLMYTEAKQ